MRYRNAEALEPWCEPDGFRDDPGWPWRSLLAPGQTAESLQEGQEDREEQVGVDHSHVRALDSTKFLSIQNIYPQQQPRDPYISALD
jgi:hypothetical protein